MSGRICARLNFELNGYPPNDILKRANSNQGGVVPLSPRSRLGVMGAGPTILPAHDIRQTENRQPCWVVWGQGATSPTSWEFEGYSPHKTLGRVSVLSSSGGAGVLIKGDAKRRYSSKIPSLRGKKIFWIWGTFPPPSSDRLEGLYHHRRAECAVDVVATPSACLSAACLLADPGVNVPITISRDFRHCHPLAHLFAWFALA